MDLTRSALEFIVESRKANLMEINGLSYSDKDIFLIKKPRAENITASTLTGFVDMVRTEKDKFAAPALVQVVSPTEVDFYSAMDGTERNREHPFNAVASLPRVVLNNYIDVENMLIQLKSQFIESEDREALIELFGHITEDNSRETGDDGFSQAVTVHTGIAMKKNVKIPSTVDLIPYRTFTEINQPKSEFVVRVHNGPSIALFEADGGVWKNKAMQDIKTYLDTALAAEQDITIVA